VAMAEDVERPHGSLDRIRFVERAATIAVRTRRSDRRSLLRNCSKRRLPTWYALLVASYMPIAKWVLVRPMRKCIIRAGDFWE
jgi:hypothetical protein